MKTKLILLLITLVALSLRVLAVEEVASPQTPAQVDATQAVTAGNAQASALDIETDAASVKSNKITKREAKKIAKELAKNVSINQPTVISEVKPVKKDYNKELDEINQYSDHFFTPHVRKVINVSMDGQTKLVQDEPNPSGSVAPVKKLRLWLKEYSKQKKTGKLKADKSEMEAPVEKDQAILDCDFMEYFADRTELQADGHVVMFFPENNSTVKADKVIYNQTSNLIKAFGKVVLINDGKEMLGDYMQIDMNEENAIMDNPQTEFFQIRARAKKGYMYGDKLIQEQGSLYVTKHTMINMKANMFGPDLDRMFVEPKNKSYFMKDSHGEKFKIKTNDLVINSKKEHDTLTLKHAEVYFNDKKIGVIPSITMHTNKNRDYVEANFPEIGTMTNMGMYAGPGFVFDTPRGSTLKVVPVLNYQSNGDNSSDNALGWGAIVKLKTATNKVDMGYGTANKTFIMSGIQKLDDKLYFQYGMNRYIDDWFMGFRMPKVLGELVYHDDFYNANFLGKDKDFNYSHRITAAYAQDGPGDGALTDGGGFIGTTRFKYMAEAAQTLFKLSAEDESPVNARLELVGQGSAALYGTGDTQTIVRIGPRLHSQYKYWMQDVGYFLSGYNDKSPLAGYDAYRYGRSNAYMRESFRLCKYLTLSWLGSMNLSGDSYNGKLIQENTFFLGIGPDDVKLNIGYDTVRQQSFVEMAMHLDAKGSTVEYKKMVIKNPDTLGKNKNGENNQNNTFIPSTSTIDENGIERAEVIDIKETL